MMGLLINTLSLIIYMVVTTSVTTYQELLTKEDVWTNTSLTIGSNIFLKEQTNRLYADSIPDTEPWENMSPQDWNRQIFTGPIKEMPRFPGCEQILASDSEKDDCANQKLMEYVYRNIRYPALAREGSIHGTVVIAFVIKLNGKMDSLKIIRNIGGGCGSEVLRVFKKLKARDLTWIPGRVHGKAVNYRYNFPVSFNLD